MNHINNDVLDNQMCFYSFLEIFVSRFHTQLQELLKNKLENNVDEIAKRNTDIFYRKVYLLSVRTLIYELYQWREGQGDQISCMTPNERYNTFCRQFRDTEYFNRFCDKYSVLVRKIDTLMKNTLSFVAEVLLHLEEDRNELEEVFGFKVESIHMIESIGEGDSHNHGRQTMLLSDGCTKLLYKPHVLWNDVFLTEIFREFNKKLTLDLKGPVTLSKESYGWQEFIEKKECDTEEQNRKFFHRYGELLCIAYCLNMTDLHVENLIGCGEYPVIIDTETVITNNSYHFSELGMDGGKTDTPQKLLNKAISASVINTFLLPNNMLGGFYDVDMSPLGGNTKQSSEVLAGYIIKNEFTDMICFEKEYYQQEPSTRINACDYLAEILDGFTECYGYILEDTQSFRTYITEKMKELQLTVRQVLRPTYIYYKFHDASNHPDYLGDSQAQIGLIGKLKSKRYREDEKMTGQADIEIMSLLEGDIPYFYENIHSRDLCSVYGVVKDFYRKSIVELVEERIDNIRFDDLLTQQRIIRLSMSTLLESNWNHEKRGGVSRLRKYMSYIREDDMAMAKAIGDYFCHEAVWDDEKKICIWPGHALMPEKLKIYPLNYYLYDGGGAVLFLHFLAKRTGDRKYRLVADCGLEGFLRSEVPEALSAFNGIGSLLYLYYSLYRIWGEEAYFRGYQEVLHRIARIELTDDLPIDYCNGLAGMAVLLENLYLKEKDPLLEKLARRYTDYCVEHLDRMTLAGLAHGYAGVILAVSGYYNICGDEAYLKEAECIIEMENRYYDPTKSNWKDMRNQEDGGDPVYWCHGATGICLSRMKAYQYTGLEVCKADIEKGIGKIESSITDLKDHSLCHGMLGNIDCLISLAEEMEEYRERIYRTIDEKYAYIMRDIRENGVVCGISNAYDMFSFMLGIPGIAYEIMRKQDRTYPSLLLLEI